MTALFLSLVLTMGISVFYYFDRSRLTFFLTACMYALFGIMVVINFPIVVLIVILSGGIYLFVEKPGVIVLVKTLVDDIIFGRTKGE